MFTLTMAGAQSRKCVRRAPGSRRPRNVSGPPGIGDTNVALLTDLYEITMLEAYFREEMTEEATFDLFVRELPNTRNFLIACGLDHALGYLESLSFSPEALQALERLRIGSGDFLDYLRGF